MNACAIIVSVKALVLSGGGARGAYEAGVIAGLYQAGETFDIVCGTSIGAINGAMVAQDNVAELSTLWQTIGTTPVISYVPLVQELRDMLNKAEILVKGSVFRRLGAVLGLAWDLLDFGPPGAILKLMGAIDPAPIQKILGQHLNYAALQRTLILSTTNVTAGTADSFYRFTDPAGGTAFAQAQTSPNVAWPLTTQNYVDVVRASASIPGAFSPVSIDVGSISLYVDGGVANNTPVGQAIDAGATDVTIILLSPDGTQPPQQIDNLAQVGFSCLALMQEKILESDLKTALRVNESVKAGSGGRGSRGDTRRAVTFRSFRPKTALSIGVLQFDKPDLIQQAFAAGLADAKTGGQVL